MTNPTPMPWLPAVDWCGYTKEEARQDATRIARHILNHQHHLDAAPLDHTTAMKATAMRYSPDSRPVPPPPQMW